jgi:hypothetical protein
MPCLTVLWIHSCRKPLKLSVDSQLAQLPISNWSNILINATFVALLEVVHEKRTKTPTTFFVTVGRI